jgi:hypothetical protein
MSDNEGNLKLFTVTYLADMHLADMHLADMPLADMHLAYRLLAKRHLEEAYQSYKLYCCIIVLRNNLS